MEKKRDINVQEIADGIVKKINEAKWEIRQLDRDRKQKFDKLTKELNALKSLDGFYDIEISPFEEVNCLLTVDQYIYHVSKGLIFDLPQGSILLSGANEISVNIDGFKIVTKEMLDHIKKLEFENDQLANHRLDPFYEPSEEVKETVEHIVEEYRDEIKEVLSVSKDAVDCRGEFSFVDPKEVFKY
ncbi:hypothetical protein [Bacillus altitudinis]|uniref:hypothetical protein n=1 Tax=Bacillus altitudinis TaxID=293387 RepID=UPI0040458FDB